MEIRRLLTISIMILFVLFVFQYFVFRYTKTLPLSPDDKASMFMVVHKVCHLNDSGLCRFHPTDTGINILDTKENFDYDTNKKVREETVGSSHLTSENLNKESFDEKGKTAYEGLVLENDNQTEDEELGYSPLMKGDVLVDSNMTADEGKGISSLGMSEITNQVTVVSNQSQGTINNSVKKVDQTYSDISVTSNTSGQEENIKNRMEKLENNNRIELAKKDSVVLNDKVVGSEVSRLSGPFISISQMYSKLSRAHNSPCLKVWISFRGSTFE